MSYGVRRILFALSALLLCAGVGSLLLTFERSSILPNQAITEIGSFAYQINLATIDDRYLPKGDDNAHPDLSILHLSESGQRLGPAHSLHDDIRTLGQGRYSHWGNTLIFSAGDNSNPKLNGRTYEVTYNATLPMWVAFIALFVGVVALWTADGTTRVFISLALLANWWAITGALLVSWRTLVICGALITSTFAYYMSLSIPERNARLETNDKIIVREQYNRAHQHDAPDYLFIGDSSCLMGIDFNQLQNGSLKSAKSLCTMAYVGPVGWAKLLKKQVEASGKPENIVFIFHPAGFKRDPGWDGWQTYLDELENENESPAKLTTRFAFAIQNGFLSDLIFRPMPGLMGIYYGSSASFAADVRRNGAAIDPGTGLPPLPKSQMATGTGKTDNGGGKKIAGIDAKVSDFSPNALFDEALRHLGETINDLGIDKKSIRILITPVPDAIYDLKLEKDLQVALQMIIKALALDTCSIIELPPTLPANEFSSITHLNRWGREKYTALLSAKLRNRGSN
jgi:hypothetical protein